VTKKKQKKAKSGKAAQPEATKLPKRIAGIKVPKELREPGGKLLEAVRHPLVMDVAAAALIAAAAGLRKGGPGDRAHSGNSAGAGATRPKPAADIGTLLAVTALEGVRRLSDAAARQNAHPHPQPNKGNGSSGNGGADS
jgi:hypothetical protein